MIFAPVRNSSINVKCKYKYTTFNLILDGSLCTSCKWYGTVYNIKPACVLDGTKQDFFKLDQPKTECTAYRNEV